MPFGDNFDKWLREQGKDPLSDTERQELNEVGAAVYRDWQENKEQIIHDIAHNIGTLLQQEYRVHEGAWWLFTLGKPARPLRPEEIEDARNRGAL